MLEGKEVKVGDVGCNMGPLVEGGYTGGGGGLAHCLSEIQL